MIDLAYHIPPVVADIAISPHIVQAGYPTITVSVHITVVPQSWSFRYFTYHSDYVTYLQIFLGIGVIFSGVPTSMCFSIIHTQVLLLTYCTLCLLQLLGTCLLSVIIFGLFYFVEVFITDSYNRIYNYPITLNMYSENYVHVMPMPFDIVNYNLDFSPTIITNASRQVL